MATCRGDKAAYSKGEAKRAASSLRRRTGRECWAYECVCGRWHLTSFSPRDMMRRAIAFGEEPER